MNLHHYSASILEGEENSDGYVCLKHGTQYTIELKNEDRWRCDAEVFIDGQRVGLWRINAKKLLRLERPAHDTGRFTFYQTDTKEAAKAGIGAGAVTGLISVVFKPEERVTRLDCPAPMTRLPGGTGLSGESKQRFVSVERIIYDDPKHFVTINLRSVAVADEPRPLFARSTPVPPAVG